jgi:hypothetical protein
MHPKITAPRTRGRSLDRSSFVTTDSTSIVGRLFVAWPLQNGTV